MDANLIQRYQAGGDIYASLKSQYGASNADNIAAAATSGDETQVNAAIVAAKYGGQLDASTWSIFGNQLATDPLGAPIESLNGQISKVLGDLFKNPLVLGAIALGLFFFFGGADVIRDWVKGGKK